MGVLCPWRVVLQYIATASHSECAFMGEIILTLRGTDPCVAEYGWPLKIFPFFPDGLSCQIWQLWVKEYEHTWGPRSDRDQSSCQRVFKSTSFQTEIIVCRSYEIDPNLSTATRTSSYSPVGPSVFLCIYPRFMLCVFICAFWFVCMSPFFYVSLGSWVISLISFWR